MERWGSVRSMLGWKALSSVEIKVSSGWGGIGFCSGQVQGRSPGQKHVLCLISVYVNLGQVAQACQSFHSGGRNGRAECAGPTLTME